VINREQNETILMPWFTWMTTIVCSLLTSYESLEQIQRWEATTSKDSGLDCSVRKRDDQRGTW